VLVPSGHKCVRTIATLACDLTYTLSSVQVVSLLRGVGPAICASSLSYHISLYCPLIPLQCTRLDVLVCTSHKCTVVTTRRSHLLKLAAYTIHWRPVTSNHAPKSQSYQPPWPSSQKPQESSRPRAPLLRRNRTLPWTTYSLDTDLARV